MHCYWVSISIILCLYTFVFVHVQLQHVCVPIIRDLLFLCCTNVCTCTYTRKYTQYTHVDQVDITYMYMHVHVEEQSLLPFHIHTHTQTPRRGHHLRDGNLVD